MGAGQEAKAVDSFFIFYLNSKIFNARPARDISKSKLKCLFLEKGVVHRGEKGADWRAVPVINVFLGLSL